MDSDGGKQGKDLVYRLARDQHGRKITSDTTVKDVESITEDPGSI